MPAQPEWQTTVAWTVGIIGTLAGLWKWFGSIVTDWITGRRTARMADIARQQTQLDNLEQHLQENRAEIIAMLRVQNEKLEAQISERDKRIAVLEHQIQENREQIRDLIAQNKQQAEEIARLESRRTKRQPREQP